MATTIYFPEMGEGVIEGTLTRWLVHEGQVVQAYDPIAELETDKVTTEISTEVGGTILELCVQEGELVPVDTILAYIGEAGDAIPEVRGEPAPVKSSNGQERAELAANGAAAEAPAPYRGRISPVVGRMAAEHGVDLAQVKGTGRDGRVTKEDMLAYLERVDTALDVPVTKLESDVEPVMAPSGGSETAAAPVLLDEGDELQPLSGMRRLIAEHMVQSKRVSPHVTTVFEFDFSAVAGHRAVHKQDFARDGAKLTYTVYIVAALVQALKQHPLVNSVWNDVGIVLKRAINIGMATAVPEGLLVPVIRDADGMNLLGMARTIEDLAQRARNKQLKPQELAGGTFSFTNHGTSGSLFATPIINQPQAGILGIGKIEKRVKVIGDAIAIRPLAYASFTFDHRILDGAAADSFVSTVKDIIEGWE